MASIEKTPRGEWKVRWRRLDGRHASRTCPTRQSAQELRREVETAQALGREWGPQAARPAQGPALIDVAEQYLRHCAISLSPRTLRVKTYQVEIWLRWCGETGVRSLDQFSGQMLAAYFTWLQEGTGRHGAPRERSTARRYLAVIEDLWKWAGDWQEERGWTVPRPRRISDQVRMPAPEWRPAPTWADMRAVISAASGWQRDLFVALFYTGLRVQQVMGLRRDDVDLEAAQLRVRAELGKSLAERAGRVVPVSRHLVTWVRELPIEADGWLIPSGRRSRLADPQDAARAWERSGVRREVWEGRPHHCFRAGWMSELKRAGVELDVVEVLVGHAPTQTARSYYDPEAFGLRAAVDKIPAHDEALGPGSRSP